MSWPYGRQTPDQNLMRFVARRFHGPGLFMDIGSGEGSNTRELRERGHAVVAVDKDPGTDATIHIDIRNYETWQNAFFDFDCIYDVNSLCHVENPPFAKIHDWLKPRAYFFSVWPTLEAPKRIEEGKKYTCRASEWMLREWLCMFSEIYVGHYSAPDFRGNQLESWIVEARP